MIRILSLSFTLLISILFENIKMIRQHHLNRGIVPLTEFFLKQEILLLHKRNSKISELMKLLFLSHKLVYINNQHILSVLLF